MLERLSMFPDGILPLFFSQMTNVRVLQLDLSGMFTNAPLITFLRRCNCLEELDLTDWQYWAVLIERSFFSHLGKTLRKLRLHQPEKFNTPRSTIEENDLDILVETCPKLRALGLDLRRKDFRGSQCSQEPNPIVDDCVSFYLPVRYSSSSDEDCC